MAKQTSTRSSSTTPKQKRSSAPPASMPKPMNDVAATDGMRSRGEPTHEQIAARALEIYRARGSSDGNELSDWLKAESELRAP